MSKPNHPSMADYQSIFDYAVEGIFQSTIDGKFLTVNPAMAHIFGYESPSEMLSAITDISEQIHVEGEGRKEFIETLLNQGQVTGFEARNYRKDGSVIWTRTNARIVRDERGNPLYFEGFLTDITSQKETELALQASEERYRILVEHLPGAVFLDSLEDSEHTIFVSPKITEVLGYSPQEWITKVSWKDIIHPDDRERVISENKRTDNTGEPFFEEYRIQRKDGEYVWVRDESTLIKDSQDQALYWQGYLLDITERKSAEEAIHESEEQFRTVFQSNPVAMCINSMETGQFIEANQAYWELSGYKPEEVLGRTGIDLGFVTEREQKKLVSKLKKKGSLKSVQGKFLRKDGAKLDTLEFYELIQFRGKSHQLSMFYDVTEQKQAEDELRESEDKYRQLFESESDAIFLIDNESGDILEANAAASALYGYSREELLEKKNSDLSAEPKNTRETTRNTPVNREQVISIPYRLHRKKDGTTFPVEITGRFFEWHERPVHIAAIRDISKRLEVQESLRASEARYRALAEASNDMIFIIDKSGIIEYVNTFAARQFGSEPESLKNISMEEIFPPDTTQRQKKNLQKVLKENKSLYIVDQTEFPDKRIWLSTWLVPLRNEEGKAHAVMGVSRDITEQVKAQQSLQENEQRLRAIIEHTTNIYYTHTADHQLTYMSPQTLQILGYANEEALIQWQDFLTDNPINQEGIKLTQKAIDTGKPQEPYILELKHKDGHPVWVEVRESPIVQEDGTVVMVGALTDITDRKKIEETLEHQVEELSILHDIASAATISKNTDELIQKITDIIGEILHPDNYGVELVTESGDMYLAHPSYRGADRAEIRMPMPISKGVTGKVIRTGKAVRLGDVSKEPAYLEVTEGVQSELCVPIRIQDRITGVINVESKMPNAFSEQNKRLLVTIAGTMATAIEQLRLFESSQRRVQEMTILNEVSRSCTEATSVDELISNVTKTISESLYPENCGVLLFNQETQTLSPHPSYHGLSKGNYPTSITLEEGICGQVASSGKPIRIGNVRKHKNYIETTPQVRSELCVPISHGKQILGVVNAESLALDAFSTNDERLLLTISSTLATSLEKLQLFETDKQRLAESENLRQATTTLTTSLEPETLMNAILESLEKIVPHDSASITMERGGKMEIVAARGFPESTNFIGKRFPIDKKWKKIASKREPLIVPDVREEKYFIPLEGSEYIRGWMAVPLITHDQIIGAINLDSRKINAFSQNDANILQTFSNSAAVAIENARLFEIEQENREHAEILLEATSSLTTTIDLESLYENILDSLAKMVPFDSASIEILDQGYLEIVAEKNLPKEYSYIGNRYAYDPVRWEHPEKDRWPIIIPDVRTDDRFERMEGTEYIRSWMGVPLLAQEKLIGFINLDNRAENFYTQTHAALAQTFGNQSAVAIENARLFKAEQQRHRESETLRQAAMALNTSLDLENVLDTLLIVMKQVVPYSSASVLLQEGDILRLSAMQGFMDPKALKDMRFPANDELYQEIRQSKQPLILPDAQTDERFTIFEGGAQDVRGWMGVPLIETGEVIGCITIDSSEPDVYDTNSATLAFTFAHQASTAIRNARQFEAEQKHLAETETLRQTSESITSSLDTQQVLDSILSNLSRVVPYQSAAIFLIEDTVVRIMAGRGFKENVNDRHFPGNNPLLQEVWRTGKPLILADAQFDPRFEKWVASDHVRGWMGVPLIVRGIIIGYITIDSRKVGAYDQDDASLTMAFAHQASAAIENARLYERSEKQIQQLTVLREIDAAISSSFDLRVTLNILVEQVTRELNVDAAAILLYNPELQSLSYYTSHGFTDSIRPQSSYIHLGEGLGSQVIVQRKLVHIQNLVELANDKNLIRIKKEGFNTYIGLPLISKGQIKGVLELYSREALYLKSTWLNFLYTLAGQAAIAIDNVQLFNNLQRTNQELTLAYDNTLEGWGRALELRDKEIQGHTRRVVEITIELARRMGIRGEDLTNILRGALLHDIGKLGIPDRILHKAGPLSDEEWKIMRQHPQFAYDLIYPIPYLRPALDIPYAHHEHWDGSGYPQGLKGEEIPIAARIFAVVDIWDALLHGRPYREAWSEEEVVEHLKNSAGKSLDPKVVEKFLALLQDDDFKYKKEAD